MGEKYLAAAIVFAVVVGALMLRYEYHSNGMIRNDRWTGRLETQCYSKDEKWMTVQECRQSR